MVDEGLLDRRVDELLLARLQRRDRETHRPVRERRRLVELDRHPVEAADVGVPASLDQRFRGRVTIGNGDAKRRRTGLDCALLGPVEQEQARALAAEVRVYEVAREAGLAAAAQHARSDQPSAVVRDGDRVSLDDRLPPLEDVLLAQPLGNVSKGCIVICDQVGDRPRVGQHDGAVREAHVGASRSSVSGSGPRSSISRLGL